MTHFQIYYVLINAIIIFVLSAILRRTDQSIARQSMVTMFKAIIVSEIIYCMIDMFSALLPGQIYSIPFVYAFINSLTYFLNAFMLFLWLNFVEFTIGYEHVENKIVLALKLIPLLVLSVFVFTSLRGYIYYFDYVNKVERYGTYNYIAHIVYFTYILIAVIRATKAARKEKNPTYKKAFYKLNRFVILAIISLVLSKEIIEYPITQLVFLPAFLLLFFDIQKAQITADALTRLNNRQRIDDYLAEKFSGSSKETRIWLAIMDMNSFKSINDTFGHLEGDHAIVSFAEAMKRAAFNESILLGRWGGDEFVAIGSNLSITAKRYRERLEASLKEVRKEQKIVYPMTCSFGYYETDVDVGTMSEVLERADKDLYKDKMTFHVINPDYAYQIRHSKKLLQQKQS